jgi:hypothetical protein
MISPWIQIEKKNSSYSICLAATASSSICVAAAMPRFQSEWLLQLAIEAVDGLNLPAVRLAAVGVKTGNFPITIKRRRYVRKNPVKISVS